MSERGLPDEARRLPRPRALSIGGGALVAAGLALLGVLLALTGRGATFGEVLAVRDGLLGAAPGVFLLLGGVALFLSNALGRARWTKHRTGFFAGGENRTVTPARPLGWSILGLVTALAAAVGLLVVPVALEPRRPSSDFWVLCGIYGCTAAALAAMVAVSLLKRATYRRLAARTDPRSIPRASRLFWQKVSGQWIAEFLLAALAAVLVGVVPLLVHDAHERGAPVDGAAIGVLLVAAAVAAVLSVVCALNSWRSGFAYGEYESIT